jgi:hypothetical protein
MLVHPEVLRAFAGQVDAASSTIHGAAVSNKVATAADGLPGSTTQWAARLVGGQVTGRRERQLDLEDQLVPDADGLSPDDHQLG